MQDRVERVAGEQGRRRRRESREQTERDEPRRHARDAIRVQRRHAAMMTGIVGAQQIGDLLAAAFAQHHAVRAHAQRRLHQIRQADRARALHIRLARDHRHVVVDRQRAQFTHLLHGDDAFRRRTFGEQRLEQRRLARASATGDEQCGSSRDQSAQHRHPLSGKQATTAQFRQRGDGTVRQTDRQGRAIRHDWGDYRVHTDAVSAGRVGDGTRVVKTPSELRAQSHRIVAHGLRVTERYARTSLAHTVAVVHPDASVTGHRHVGDARVTHDGVERTERDRLKRGDDGRCGVCRDGAGRDRAGWCRAGWCRDG